MHLSISTLSAAVSGDHHAFLEPGKEEDLSGFDRVIYVPTAKEKPLEAGPDLLMVHGGHPGNTLVATLSSLVDGRPWSITDILQRFGDLSAFLTYGPVDCGEILTQGFVHLELDGFPSKVTQLEGLGGYHQCAALVESHPWYPGTAQGALPWLAADSEGRAPTDLVQLL